MSRVLTIPINGVYFDQILKGEKTEEYRLNTEYWKRRLIGRTFDAVVLTRGYPKGGGIEGVTRITRPWRGQYLKRISHPHFGPRPVWVFAINVGEQAA